MEDKYEKSRRGQPNGGLVGGEARKRAREREREKGGGKEQIEYGMEFRVVSSKQRQHSSSSSSSQKVREERGQPLRRRR